MPLQVGTLMPAFEGATEWLGGETFTDKMGCPTLVQFWAVSCPVCKMNVPRLLEFTETYKGSGLRLVSVHMPRMEADMDTSKVADAVREMNLAGPCAVDNAHTVGDRFQTGGVWPCYFFFDAHGKLRSRAAGALGLKMAENSLRRLLTEQPAGGKELVPA